MTPAGTAGERRPGRTTTVAVEVAVHALPRGGTRDRYRREFLADLHELEPRRRGRYALGVLTQMLPLRAALDRTSRSAWEVLVGPRIRKPLLCRLNLRHHWVTSSTEDGSARFRACSRCGKEFAIRFAPIYPSGPGL